VRDGDSNRITTQLRGIPNFHPGILCKGSVGHLWNDSGTNFTGSISASTLRDYSSTRTIRTFKSHLQLSSEAHFILADSWPGLNYSTLWSVSRPVQLRERHAFNINRKDSKNRSLIDTDGVTANRQASARSLFKLNQVPFHNSKYSQPCHMCIPITRR
jgi:hypothetical protein